MTSRTQCLVLILLLGYAALVAVAEVRIKKLERLEEVPASGDSYPGFLPNKTAPKPFTGKKVLFAISHGVEDHEVYYQHQYFTSRGASVVFGCPSYIANNGKKVVLADFFRPSYLVDCVDLDKTSLDSFDAVFVAGGIPSSSDLRITNFPRQMYDFWANEKNSDKVLAVICSGVETLIEAGILPHLTEVVGSPASKWSVVSALKALGMPETAWKGDDDNVNAITLPSDGSRAHLVLGKNPNASPAFVVAIGNTWAQLNETIPNSDGVPLNFVNGHYQHPQFTVPTSLDQLPGPSAVNTLPNAISTRNAGKKVGIAFSSGATDQEVLALVSAFRKNNVDTVALCPWWVPPYKDSKLFLHTQPPSRPTYVATCDFGFKDTAQISELDGVVVPGGLFSTNSVLRTDGDLSSLLLSLNQKGKLLGFLDTAAELLISTPGLLQAGAEVPTGPYVTADINNAGYHAVSYLLSVYSNPGRGVVVISKDNNDHDSVDTFVRNVISLL